MHCPMSKESASEKTKHDRRRTDGDETAADRVTHRLAAVGHLAHLEHPTGREIRAREKEVPFRSAWDANELLFEKTFPAGHIPDGDPVGRRSDGEFCRGILVDEADEHGIAHL